MSGVANIAQQLRDLAANGVSYASPMPGFAAQLTDEEIAAVINHERQELGPQRAGRGGQGRGRSAWATRAVRALTGVLLDIGQTS